MDGIINILKPIGMTSTDVVRWVLRNTLAKKAGHIGTLDPGAAGVLPICVGKATRLAEYHTQQGKTYRAEITLGITTDTQDAFGIETARSTPHLSEQDFLGALEKFRGSITQVPPMYSAVKKNGKPLYAYARQGIELKREVRQVIIRKLEMIEWIPGIYPKALIEIDCSKGTYIRTLCQDIGEELGCGAHMSFLLRTRAGRFEVQDAYTLEEIEKQQLAGQESFVLPVQWGLELPKISLPYERLKAFQNGLPTGKNMLQAEGIDQDLPVKVFYGPEFIGIGSWRDDCLCPQKVF